MDKFLGVADKEVIFLSVYFILKRKELLSLVAQFQLFWVSTST